MNKNQKGFGVVEILIVIVAVGLIVVVCWLVFDRQNNKTASETEKKPPASQQKAKQETPAETVSQESIPEGWKMYDSNSHFSFIYPTEWEKIVKVSEYPISETFNLRYFGEVTINKNLDGWVYAAASNGATSGSKADVTQEAANNNLKVWRFGFGDAGYASLIPTFVASGKIYQITTGSACPEKSADCMAGEEYTQVYDKLVGSIKLK